MVNDFKYVNINNNKNAFFVIKFIGYEDYEHSRKNIKQYLPGTC